VPGLFDGANLCLYTTGSYPRGEAGQHSDLDVFFLQEGADEVPFVTRAAAVAALEHVRQGTTPLDQHPFSGGGRFLQAVFRISDLVGRIGDPAEDAANIFTARMLLLLESASLAGDRVYRAAINTCIDGYCRDFHDHQENFLPTFLVNDIVRFWKTLCLNYENRRRGYKEVGGAEDSPEMAKAQKEAKGKDFVKVFKLKHSRMMTCYSMLACLCDPEEGRGPERLRNLVNMRAIERFRHIAGKHKRPDLCGQLEEEYAWFLQETDHEESTLLVRLVDNKAQIRRRAGTFGGVVYDLLGAVAKASNNRCLRYLVV
jgi:hypothetical protein